MKMITCAHCGNKFSRVDSMQRHVAKYCGKSLPPHHMQSRSDIKQAQPNRRNKKDATCADIIIVVTKMLQEHRREWKRDFKNFKMHKEMSSKQKNDDDDLTCSNDEDSSCTE